MNFFDLNTFEKIEEEFLKLDSQMTNEIRKKEILEMKLELLKSNFLKYLGYFLFFNLSFGAISFFILSMPTSTFFSSISPVFDFLWVGVGTFTINGQIVSNILTERRFLPEEYKKLNWFDRRKERIRLKKEIQNCNQKIEVFNDQQYRLHLFEMKKERECSEDLNENRIVDIEPIEEPYLTENLDNIVEQERGKSYVKKI